MDQHLFIVAFEGYRWTIGATAMTREAEEVFVNSDIFPPQALAGKDVRNNDGMT